MAKVYEWKCKVCDKVIADVSQKRYEYNVEQHIESHKRKEDN